VPNPNEIDAAVPSPCIDVCRLDPRGLCVGCRRTIEEIIEWPRAVAARRREILRAVTLRGAADEPLPPGHSR
jgi:predicted Fe-S protein YdhL (DUF1289 family)